MPFTPLSIQNIQQNIRIYKVPRAPTKKMTLTASVTGRVKAADVILPYFPPQTRVAQAERGARGCVAHPPHVRLAFRFAPPYTATPAVPSIEARPKRGRGRGRTETRPQRAATALALFKTSMTSHHPSEVAQLWSRSSIDGLTDKIYWERG